MTGWLGGIARVSSVMWWRSWSRVVVVGGESAAFRSRKSIQAVVSMSLGGGGGRENRGLKAAADCRVMQNVPLFGSGV